MTQNILTFDNHIGSDEYCCTIVRIGEITPIEGSDFLGVTNVNNIPIVVRKADVKTGDILFYAPLGSALCNKFLRVNNMYNLSVWEMNSNAEEARPFIEEYIKVRDTEGKTAAEPLKKSIRQYTGLFDQYGQVTQIKLQGILSSGFLFGIKELEKMASNIHEVDLESMVNLDFNMVNGEVFIQAFIPPVKEKKPHKKGGPRPKICKRMGRMIPGKEIIRHYDTNLFSKPRYLEALKPADNIVISVKIHGTSFIIGNTEVLRPKWDGIYRWLYFKGWLPRWARRTITENAVVYSTRNHIINKDMNPANNDRLGNSKAMMKYTEYYNILKDYIPEGYTLYGEIFGYITGKKDMYIQKNFDYGCEPGRNKLMIYRITQRFYDGTIHELDINEVSMFTKSMMKAMIDKYPDIENIIMPMDILYHGIAKDLYPDITVDENWSINFLNAIKKDHDFHMEENEPLCRNKVPREGVVIRIDHDVIPRAFKVKCQAFTDMEKKAIDKGTYEDIEAYDAQLDEDEIESNE